MPRGLSRVSDEAKAALMEGYQNRDLLPAGRTLHHRLADFVYARLGERYTDHQVGNALMGLSRGEGSFRLQPRGGARGRGLSDDAKAELRRVYLNRAELGFPSGGMALWTALADHLKAALPSESSIAPEQLRATVDNMKRSNQLHVVASSSAATSADNPYYPVAAPEEEERPIVLHHHGMMFSGQDHVVVPNNEVHYDEHLHLYVDSRGQTVTPHWIDDEFF